MRPWQTYRRSNEDESQIVSKRKPSQRSLVEGFHFTAATTGFKRFLSLKPLTVKVKDNPTVTHLCERDLF